jgi:hypothetical protein
MICSLHPLSRYGHRHFYRFHNPCDGTRSARLNLLDEFSQAMVAVSSTMASSSNNDCNRAKSASSTLWSVIVIASVYSSAVRSNSE